MNRRTACPALSLVTLAVTAPEAYAHHVMGGRMPETFIDGLLSGLGHPVIGLDHFAAVVAVGCLAAAHGAAAALVVGFVAAMMAGVALHLYGAPLPAAEIWVALSVVALGVAMLRRTQIGTSTALALFAVTGLLHGYALGESIYGAEPAPLYAYLIGLALIQSAVALAAMGLTRLAASRHPYAQVARIVGAGITGIGLAIFVQQIAQAV